VYSGGCKYNALGAQAPTKNNIFTLIIVLIFIFFELPNLSKHYKAQEVQSRQVKLQQDIYNSINIIFKPS
jgi:hypothetical protein